jgi:hypothetical protein
MQTFLSFLAISDPSLRALMIIGALSLGLLAVFRAANPADSRTIADCVL